MLSGRRIDCEGPFEGLMDRKASQTTVVVEEGQREVQQDVSIPHPDAPRKKLDTK